MTKKEQQQWIDILNEVLPSMAKIQIQGQKEMTKELAENQRIQNMTSKFEYFKVMLENGLLKKEEAREAIFIGVELKIDYKQFIPLC